MATIYIDNEPYDVKDGQNLLQACLNLGFEMPFFCWHPALHSVGACRQCTVKQFRDEKDTRGRLVMACMTPATEGTRISISDAEAASFRRSVVEWLMLNHPHDCPVCDEGGECHLQDMTYMTGHTVRRYQFKKRTYRNQYLGPFVNHELNRCIQCYRCVRYYNDYAGGDDLQVYGAHQDLYFGRNESGVLENEFAGNLVEVCPTGVFTDRTHYKHYARNWDLQTAPSVCVHCSVGCNTIPGERFGLLRRIRNRYSYEVNGYFLCDRGRYGYEFVNSERRLRHPLTREGTAPAEVVSPEDAVARVRAELSSGQRMIGIGSPRASLEANYALRSLVGADNFYLGVSDSQRAALYALREICARHPEQVAGLREAENCDAVLVLGEDVTNVAPRLALALRQASRQAPLKAAMRARIPYWEARALRTFIQGAKGPFFSAHVCATKLDEVATATRQAAPDDLVRVGLAVAGALGASQYASAVAPEGTADFVSAAAAALTAAERPLIVAGTSLNLWELVHAAGAVLEALAAAGRPAMIACAALECNSLGLALLGGGALGEALSAASEGKIGTAVILENDLYRHADATEVERFLRGVPQVIALDSLDSPTTDMAAVTLPTTFAEGEGTLVNHEGRAQRFYKVMAPRGEIKDSWRWLGELAGAKWKTIDDVFGALVAEYPQLAPFNEITPPAGFRIGGTKVPRQTKRISARTAMFAHMDVHEPPPADDPDSALAFSMEGYPGMPPAPLIQRYRVPGWNSVQALHKFQSEVNGPLRSGTAGARVLGGPPAAAPAQIVTIAPQVRRPGEWLLVPLYHIFGSEEFSVHTPGVAELAPAPYLALTPHEAEEIGLNEGDLATVELGGSVRELPVRIVPSLPDGVAGVPVGLPGLGGFVLPAWAPVGRPAARGGANG